MIPISVVPSQFGEKKILSSGLKLSNGKKIFQNCHIVIYVLSVCMIVPKRKKAM